MYPKYIFLHFWLPTWLQRREGHFFNLMPILSRPGAKMVPVSPTTKGLLLFRCPISPFTFRIYALSCWKIGKTQNRREELESSELSTQKKNICHSTSNCKCATNRGPDQSLKKVSLINVIKFWGNSDEHIYIYIDIYIFAGPLAQGRVRF